MAAINPYLNFLGNTEEVFNFYKSVFGGEFSTFQRFKDIPGGDKMSPEDQNKIMHVALPIGKITTLMASDVLESMGQNIIVGNNFYLSLNADTEKETDQLFNALSADGKIEMPLEKTFWGAYFGMFQDKFGVKWMINHDLNQK